MEPGYVDSPSLGGLGSLAPQPLEPNLMTTQGVAGTIDSHVTIDNHMGGIPGQFDQTFGKGGAFGSQVLGDGGDLNNLLQPQPSQYLQMLGDPNDQQMPGAPDMLQGFHYEIAPHDNLEMHGMANDLQNFQAADTNNSRRAAARRKTKSSKPTDLMDDEQILREIEVEGKERIENTMVGRLASLIRRNGPMSVIECTSALLGHYDELRKPDGTKYKGTLEKAVNGSLYSTGVFHKNDDDRWTISEMAILEYEERLQKKFEQKSKKRKALSKDGVSRLTARVKDTSGVDVKRPRMQSPSPSSMAMAGDMSGMGGNMGGHAGDEGGALGSVQRTQTKAERIIGRLAKISMHHSSGSGDAQLAAEMKKPPLGMENEGALISQADHEVEDALRKALGDDMFVFLLQLLNYNQEIYSRGTAGNSMQLPPIHAAPHVPAHEQPQLDSGGLMPTNVPFGSVSGDGGVGAVGSSDVSVSGVSARTGPNGVSSVGGVGNVGGVGDVGGMGVGGQPGRGVDVGGVGEVGAVGDGFDAMKSLQAQVAELQSRVVMMEAQVVQDGGDGTYSSSPNDFNNSNASVGPVPDLVNEQPANGMDLMPQPVMQPMPSYPSEGMDPTTWCARNMSPSSSPAGTRTRKFCSPSGPAISRMSPALTPAGTVIVAISTGLLCDVNGDLSMASQLETLAAQLGWTHEHLKEALASADAPLLFHSDDLPPPRQPLSPLRSAANLPESKKSDVSCPATSSTWLSGREDRPSFPTQEEEEDDDDDMEEFLRMVRKQEKQMRKEERRKKRREKKALEKQMRMLNLEDEDDGGEENERNSSNEWIEEEAEEVGMNSESEQREGSETRDEEEGLLLGDDTEDELRGAIADEEDEAESLNDFVVDDDSGDEEESEDSEEEEESGFGRFVHSAPVQDYNTEDEEENGINLSSEKETDEAEDSAGSLDDFIVDDDDEEDDDDNDDDNKNSWRADPVIVISDSEDEAPSSSDIFCDEEEEEWESDRVLGILDSGSVVMRGVGGSSGGGGGGSHGKSGRKAATKTTTKTRTLRASPTTDAFSPRTTSSAELRTPEPRPRHTSCTSSSAKAGGAGASTGKRRRRLTLSFNREKDALAASLYARFNDSVFGGALPPFLLADRGKQSGSGGSGEQKEKNSFDVGCVPLTWNRNLTKTAGLTYTSRGTIAAMDMGAGVGSGLRPFVARIELSAKVVDSPSKLSETLLHEMCHAAAWLLPPHQCKPPHGPSFWRWARKAMAAHPELQVSTCHAYEIHYKWRWRCENSECAAEIGRHSNSLNVERYRCARCGGRFLPLGTFRRDGTRTPVQARRPPSAWCLYVKEHLGPLKAARPGAAHGDLMKELGARWKARGAPAAD